MRIKITVSYDGTAYCGWQVQPNGVTVQEEIEKAVLLATGENVRVTGSGRTDAGVHAKGQVAHFDTNCSIPPEKIFKALNVHLPSDIRVLSSQEAEEDFHACLNAKTKTYKYSLYKAEVENPLKERYAVKIDGEMDVEKMKEASLSFVGEHDFKAFCASGSSVKTTVRTIYDINIDQLGQDLTITIKGNGFLYNMVRIMVGALIAVGKGETQKADIEKMLLTGKRHFNVKTLPSKALCLEKVEY